MQHKKVGVTLGLLGCRGGVKRSASGRYSMAALLVWSWLCRNVPSLRRLKAGFFQSRAFAQSKCYAMSSPPTTPMSQASTRFGLDSSISLEDVKGLRRRAVERVKQVSTSQDIFLFLGAFRILNALSVRNFFQPDEYFQSLEPAWQIAFGKDSGAWITWVNNTAKKRVQQLMSRAGVEEPSSICNSPNHIRCCLLVGILSCLDLAIVSHLPCRPPDRGA